MAVEGDLDPEILVISTSLGCHKCVAGSLDPMIRDVPAIGFGLANSFDFAGIAAPMISFCPFLCFGVVVIIGPVNKFGSINESTSVTNSGPTITFDFTDNQSCDLCWYYNPSWDPDNASLWILLEIATGASPLLFATIFEGADGSLTYILVSLNDFKMVLPPWPIDASL